MLFGTRGSIRTLPPGRRQVNVIVSQKREHSRKPEELYDVIERCSAGPYLELFARHGRPGWSQWGNEVGEDRPALVRANGGQLVLGMAEAEGDYAADD